MSEHFFLLEPPPGWAMFPLARDMAVHLSASGEVFHIHDWTQWEDIDSIHKHLKKDPDTIVYCGDIHAAEKLRTEHGVPPQNMSFIYHSMKEMIEHDIMLRQGFDAYDSKKFKDVCSVEEIADILQRWSDYEISDELIEFCKRYARIGYLNKKQEHLLRKLCNKHHVPQAVDCSTYFPPTERVDSDLVFGAALSTFPHRMIKNIDLLSEIVRYIDETDGIYFDARAIHYPGPGVPYDHMLYYYHAIDVFLCTSIEEGGPLSPLQAGACGVPSISTHCGHMPEFIHDGVTGFLVEPTLESFIECIDFLKSNKETVLEMRKAVRDHTASNWSCESKEKEWKSFLGITKPTRKLLPVEKEEDYALDLNWYDRGKPKGISFLIRAKNEERTIGLALDSIRDLQVPHEINLFLNCCGDRTEEIALERKNAGQPINIFHYPHVLGKTGVENLCTPITSVHSTIWYLNWATNQSNYSYTFRYDADFVMTSVLRRRLEEIFKDTPNSPLYRIPALFSDTGKENNEIYLFSNTIKPFFYKFLMWHAMKFENVDEYKDFKVIKGSVIHDSDLNDLKEYWNHDPWWETDLRENTQKIREETKAEFDKIKQMLGDKYVTEGRASWFKSDKTAKKLYRHYGIKSEYINQLTAPKKCKHAEVAKSTSKHQRVGVSWFLQKEGYELGNFVMATPMLYEMSKTLGPIDVFFETPELADLFDESEFIHVLESKPAEKPFGDSSLLAKGDLTNSEAFMKKFLNPAPPVTQTHVPRIITKRLQKESGKKYIGIAHGCLGSVWKNKKSISSDLLQQIVDLVAGKDDFVPVLLGSQADADSFWNNIHKDNCLNYLGQLKLKDSISILSQCDGFISNDTGLYHVAGAFEIPGVILWKDTDFKRNKSPSKVIKHLHCNELADNQVCDKIESFLNRFSGVDHEQEAVAVA